MTLLDKPVQFLKGVGPRRAEALARMRILCARDLLYHVPRRYDDASTITPLELAQVGMNVTAVGEVRSKGVVPTRSGLRIFQAVIQDDTGIITCAWPGQPWVERGMRVGDRILVTGPVKFFHGRQIQPREHTLLARASDGTPSPDSAGRIFAIYPASDELPQWIFRRVFSQNLDWLLKQVRAEEYLPAAARRDLMELPEALGTLHRPRSLAEVDGAKRRLAYDELFFLQLLQARERYRATRERPGIAFRRNNELIRALHGRLPFKLTGAQIAALREIYADMTSARRMNRMLQGDVGSGKTLVALFAMLLAVEGGYQAAMMAPTEVVADRQAATLRELLTPLGGRVELVTGSVSAGEKRRIWRDVERGGVHVVVGTQAIIQRSARFARLNLAVVDEQHRFGVQQRGEIRAKGYNPHLLAMSATPIPRTLALTVYGDLDVSALRELPGGRRPVKTSFVPNHRRGEAYAFVRREVAKGRQAFIVFPIIEESESLNARSATEEHKRLTGGVFADLADDVGLLHGRMSATAKERVMRAFRDGAIRILVSTSVIEVGIDVPNATVILIEGAERFGLAQLHQLRGRVGRGEHRSYCLLMSETTDATENARLRTLQTVHDGFTLAERDLELRGPGDVLGTRQSGALGFRFASVTDLPTIQAARADAESLMRADAELRRPEHVALAAAVARLLQRNEWN